MIEDFAIRVKNISKVYRLYQKPFHRLTEALHPLRRKYHHDFAALRDVSFEIKRGEIVGVVGKNGCGKSTLLKILTGVLSPSSGSVEVRGRVAALLELGAGFSPELSGRENIYLNGAIMGYSSQEIDEKINEIIEFADIGEFIDQPVKLYSSGMFVRLAFSVAINVDPDILIVDEALSVGDAFFQAKSLMRMKKMLDENKTVLFVSHDLASLKALCSRGILLEEGQVKYDTNIADVVEAYFNSVFQNKEVPEKSSASTPVFDLKPSDPSNSKMMDFMRIRNGSVEVSKVAIKNEKNEKRNIFSFDEVACFEVEFVCHKQIEGLSYGYHIRDRNGIDVLYSDSEITGVPLPSSMNAGEKYNMSFKVNLPLSSGAYTLSIVLSKIIDVNLGKVEFCDFVPLAGQFEVSPREGSPIYGKVCLPTEVSVNRL